jgi:hypothetical protein
MRSIHFTFLAMAIGVGACATPVPPHEALPLAARDKIANTELAVPIKQSEIYVFVPNSQIATYGGGGLLLALIDVGVNSVRTGKAEDAVKPLRDSIVDFNFDETMSSELRTSLSAVSWMGVDSVHPVKDVTNKNLDGILDASKDGAVMFATTDYHLSNDADLLYITLNASLFANNDALRALKQTKKSDIKTMLANALYHNVLVFVVKPDGATSDRDKNIALWSANNGAAMRTALKSGASELAAMLAADVQQSDPPAPGDAKGERTVEGITGQIIASDAGGSVVRFKDGTLKYASTSVQ